MGSAHRPSPQEDPEVLLSRAVGQKEGERFPTGLMHSPDRGHWGSAPGMVGALEGSLSVRVLPAASNHI